MQEEKQGGEFNKKEKKKWGDKSECMFKKKKKKLSTRTLLSFIYSVLHVMVLFVYFVLFHLKSRLYTCTGDICSYYRCSDPSFYSFFLN